MLSDKEYKKELKNLMKEMSDEAKKVRQDYIKNPSKESGSYIHIHENSPFLATKEQRLIKFDGKDIKIEPDTDE